MIGAGGRTRRSAALAAGLMMLWAAAGCSDHGVQPTGSGAQNLPPVSYTAEIQPIWDTYCTGCHFPGGNGNLDLNSGVSWNNIVNAPATGYPGVRIAIGDPGSSILFLKLSGAAGVGGRMPATGVLPAADLLLVQRWILEGAQDN